MRRQLKIGLTKKSFVQVAKRSCRVTTTMSSHKGLTTGNLSLSISCPSTRDWHLSAIRPATSLEHLATKLYLLMITRHLREHHSDWGKKNDWQPAIGCKTRHGRTSTATSSTTTTTREAQSHKHAPSQFSFTGRIPTTAARGVNKRWILFFLFFFWRDQVFLGVK